MNNEGDSTHTFTIDGLGVDQELKPGESADIDVTLPASGTVAYYCRFHKGQGMQGAFSRRWLPLAEVAAQTLAHRRQHVVALHIVAYPTVDRKKARANPSTVTRPTTLPPCSKASGIIVSASMVRMAPAAKAWMTAITLPDAPPRTA